MPGRISLLYSRSITRYVWLKFMTKLTINVLAGCVHRRAEISHYPSESSDRLPCLIEHKNSNNVRNCEDDKQSSGLHILHEFQGWVWDGRWETHCMYCMLFTQSTAAAVGEHASWGKELLHTSTQQFWRMINNHGNRAQLINQNYVLTCHHVSWW